MLLGVNVHGTSDNLFDSYLQEYIHGRNNTNVTKEYSLFDVLFTQHLR